MRSILTSALLGLGLVAGTALAAQAQSVSSLPPGAAAAAPQSAVTQPYGSTESYYPKPGGSVLVKEHHDQLPPDYATNPAWRPYSAAGMGPKPN